MIDAHDEEKCSGGVGQNTTKEINFRVERGDLPKDGSRPLIGKKMDGSEFERIKVNFRSAVSYIAHVTVISDSGGYHLIEFIPNGSSLEQYYKELESRIFDEAKTIVKNGSYRARD